MNGSFTEIANIALAAIAGVVALSIVLGAVDLIRQPGWAWRTAGEPKLVCLLLVLLLPGVGLAIYVFGARPKVVAIASTGRAANLPFERFGDHDGMADERARPIQLLAFPTALGSFGEPLATRPLKANEHQVGRPGAEVVTNGVATELSDTGTLMTTTASEPGALHVPGGMGRPYNPRQRTSFLESETLAAVAAEIMGATQDVPEHAGAARPPHSAGIPAMPQPGSPPGSTLSAGTKTANRPSIPGAGATTGLPLMTTPRVTPESPEIFRPRPHVVAPISGGAPVEIAPSATMAARWMNDPTGRHQYRYWNGGSWTENVYDAGVESRDNVLD